MKLLPERFLQSRHMPKGRNRRAAWLNARSAMGRLAEQEIHPHFEAKVDCLQC